jgi:hypothetical protein
MTRTYVVLFVFHHAVDHCCGCEVGRMTPEQQNEMMQAEQT